MCIIPARKNSSRLKLKNLKKLGKISLVEHTILQAKKSNIFDKIYVSTDILKLKSICVKHDVEFFYRKEYVDNISSVSLATHDLIKKKKLNVSFDFVIQLMVTCPLRKPIDIQKSFNNFIKKKNNFQISAFRISWLHFSWAYLLKKNELIKYFNNDKAISDNHILFPTGAIWIAKMSNFIKSKTFFGPNFKFFEISWISAIDIDTKEDLKNVKLIYNSIKN